MPNDAFSHGSAHMKKKRTCEKGANIVYEGDDGDTRCAFAEPGQRPRSALIESVDKAEYIDK